MNAASDAIPDFDGAQSFEHILQRFVRSARSIMFDHQLEYRGGSADISAVKLYLKLHQNPEIWWDTAIDGADEQFDRGTWYVRQKKGPAYWRLDITAGCRSLGVQAGLLIRAINCIDGPARALHTVLLGRFKRHAWDEGEIRLAREIHGRPIFGNAGLPLRLVRRSYPLRAKLYVGPRINIPRHHNNTNWEGITTWEAPLRIATWRMRQNDKVYVD